MSSFPYEALDRLADLLVKGKVAFFIGAGFSLDSEGNTTDRLIARLLVRFDAMTQLFTDGGLGELCATFPQMMGTTSDLENKAADLRRTIDATFGLKPQRDHLGRGDYPYDCASKLRGNYYEINDWMCSAFSELLCEIHKICPKNLENRQEILEWLSQRISADEQERLLDRCRLKTRFDVPMSTLKLAKYLKTESPMGKALFLDAMGFADEMTMSGDHKATSLPEVRKSYKNRLCPRHIILGRFAREGFSRTLITTNYDLLLEGGYRLSGFKNEASRDGGTLSNRFEHFSVVANARTFFKRGHDSTIIAKIHGCTGLYRDNRDQGSDDDWCHYLSSMVFTYREIQNWRNDSWSRDYVRTLFRSHTIVFCGYSLQDAVIHDTTRTVYEEMEKNQQNNSFQEGASASQAPAFFFDRSGVRAFYAMEILRAASKAVGAEQPSLTGHTNLLEFNTHPLIHCPSGESLPNNRPEFPDLDDLFQWLYHSALRKQQQQAIRTHLKNIATLYLGHTPRSEVNEVLNNFEQLLNQEKKHIDRWSQPASVTSSQKRNTFRHITDWTEQFQPCMLRELALSLMLQGERERLQDRLHRDPHQYAAIRDHAQLAALAVVVELALRNLIKDWRNNDQDDAWLIRPAAGRFPGVEFSLSSEKPVRHYMGFMAPMGSFGGLPTASDRPDGVFNKVIFRQISSQNFRASWWCDNPYFAPISPKDLWCWARGIGPGNNVAKLVIEGRHHE